MARLLLYLACSYFLFGKIIEIALTEQGPEIAKHVLSMDQKHLQQLKSVDTRITKTANQKIARDLMETGPLQPVVHVLSEETRAYLQEHPEALPGVLQNYAGTVDLGLKLLPQLQEMFKGIKASEPQKFDY